MISKGKGRFLLSNHLKFSKKLSLVKNMHGVFVKIFVQELGLLGDAKFWECGLKGAFLRIDSSKACRGSDAPVILAVEASEQAASQGGGRSPRVRGESTELQTQLCARAARGAPSHCVPRAGLWTGTGLWSGELKFMVGHPSHRVAGSQGLEESPGRAHCYSVSFCNPVL